MFMNASHVSSCSVLHCVAVRVAVWCSVVQCGGVCSIVLLCDGKLSSTVLRVAVCCSVAQCVAVCCSVLQRVAAWCSMLQCVAVCCSDDDKSCSAKAPCD